MRVEFVVCGLSIQLILPSVDLCFTVLAVCLNWCLFVIWLYYGVLVDFNFSCLFDLFWCCGRLLINCWWLVIWRLI